ncbi:LysR family transcriptional regulator [Undibacterium terreum]|uniref:LysR family transcriptional regulator n=1 Tax=Undibacterium terreum TaxID=1224302 RepID=A0A916V113_9BURK|nr:LysR family transcriptional regulator [Undibacterium terreum]GGD00747.1 LysR family transcriptional regulator [Undibacterium terreum]
MDRLKAMQTFVRIVEANSFSKAAETLNLPRASLTATMQNLEAFLGTKLLQRTTRRLSLTSDGAHYFQKCVEILASIEEAETTFRGPDSHRPKGKLRVDLPGAVGRNLVLPHISSFHAAYPEVELVISLTDRLVDLTQEGIDVALRVGDLQDSSMIGRRIGNMGFLTCAAPSYLASRGVPETIQDLSKHQSIVHFSGRTGRAFDWDFTVDGKAVKVEMSGPVAINDADANLCCALQGLGLAQCGRYQVRTHLESGALVEVLAEWPPTPMPVSLLYPQGRMASSKLSVFAEWITALFLGYPDLQA